MRASSICWRLPGWRSCSQFFLASLTRLTRLAIRGELSSLEYRGVTTPSRRDGSSPVESLCPRRLRTTFTGIAPKGLASDGLNYLAMRSRSRQPQGVYSQPESASEPHLCLSVSHVRS